MIDAKETYCGHHFTIFMSQTIILFTLNLYNDYINYISIKLVEIKVK